MTQEPSEEVQEETTENVVEQTEPFDMWEIVQKRARKNWYIIC